MTTESIQQGIEEVIKQIDVLRRVVITRAAQDPFSLHSLQQQKEGYDHYSVTYDVDKEDQNNHETVFIVGLEKECQVKKHRFKLPFSRREYIQPIEGGLYSLEDWGQASVDYQIRQLQPDVAIFHWTYHSQAQEGRERILSALRQGSIDKGQKEIWNGYSSRITEPTEEDVYRMKSFLEKCEPWIHQQLGITLITSSTETRH